MSGSRTLVLVYFAWVRERIGRDGETLAVPPEVDTVIALVEWLRGRSDGHAAALVDPARLRAAIDQRFVPLDAPLDQAREVALFPPVTGG